MGFNETKEVKKKHTHTREIVSQYPHEKSGENNYNCMKPKIYTAMKEKKAPNAHSKKYSGQSEVKKCGRTVLAVVNIRFDS